MPTTSELGGGELATVIRHHPGMPEWPFGCGDVWGWRPPIHGCGWVGFENFGPFPLASLLPLPLPLCVPAVFARQL